MTAMIKRVTLMRNSIWWLLAKVKADSRIRLFLSVQTTGDVSSLRPLSVRNNNTLPIIPSNPNRVMGNQWLAPTINIISYIYRISQTIFFITAVLLFEFIPKLRAINRNIKSRIYDVFFFVSEFFTLFYYFYIISSYFFNIFRVLRVCRIQFSI